MFGGWAGDAVAVGAIVSAFGALNGWILLQGQIPFAAARDRLFPKPFQKQTANGAPWFGLAISSVLISGLVFLNYNASLVDQFTFIILLATLTTLVPYAFSAAAELMLFISDRERFSAPRLVKDAVVASLALAYALWTIAGSGYQVVFRGFMLLMLGIPVYIYMKWRAAKDDVPEPAAVDLTPVDTRIAVGVGE
jgi:APA family basic amino acid/polyamine antiporter